ncbi:MAG TPA: SRPBCC domain-containing protein [Acidimicrobiia bacterium]
MTKALTLDFDVRCDATHAFDVWTARTSMWWPPDHTVSGGPTIEVTIEPGIGGRIFELTPDGTEHDWGEVTVWEPPRRLGYVWHIGQPRADATDVLITFEQTADAHCHVSIVHTGWERLGVRADERRRRNRYGWDTVLPSFVAAAEA